MKLRCAIAALGLYLLSACISPQHVRFTGPPGAVITIGQHVLAANQPTTFTLPANVLFNNPLGIGLADSWDQESERGVNKASFALETQGQKTGGFIEVHQFFPTDTDQMAVNTIEITNANLQQIEQGNVVSFWCKSPSGQTICTIKLGKQN